jgi:rod shape-determining protein MreC
VQSQARLISSVIGLFFLSLILTAYSVRNPKLGRIGSGVFQEVSSPLSLSLDVVYRKLSGVWGSYVWLVDVASRNDKLEKELWLLRSEVIRLRELAQENSNLRSLLEFRQATGFKGKVANVIGYDPTGWLRTVTVDKGKVHDIKELLPVIQSGAVVGHVSVASRNTAQILLLTDRASGVAGVVQRSRARGIVYGAGSNYVRFDYVSVDEDVVVGDIVVTSGMDGIFPKGLEIGQVVRIRNEPGEVFKSLSIQPSVDFAHLENVFIATDFEAPLAEATEEGE